MYYHVIRTSQQPRQQMTRHHVTSSQNDKCATSGDMSAQYRTGATSSCRVIDPDVIRIFHVNDHVLIRILYVNNREPMRTCHVSTTQLIMFVITQTFNISSAIGTGATVHRNGDPVIRRISGKQRLAWC